MKRDNISGNNIGVLLAESLNIFSENIICNLEHLSTNKFFSFGAIRIKINYLFIYL